ncbi:putative metal-binding motif-containing protein [Candidatus Woesearchaeota archaeon]|nr:putative metal-binding motif-containing protein [Candidatus Woesearchaeota archaeon]
MKFLILVSFFILSFLFGINFVFAGAYPVDTNGECTAGRLPAVKVGDWCYWCGDDEDLVCPNDFAANTCYPQNSDPATKDIDCATSTLCSQQPDETFCKADADGCTWCTSKSGTKSLVGEQCKEGVGKTCEYKCVAGQNGAQCSDGQIDKYYYPFYPYTCAENTQTCSNDCTFSNSYADAGCKYKNSCDPGIGTDSCGNNCVRPIAPYTTSGSEAGMCNDGIDNDCDGKWDYDTLDRGPEGNVPSHGDDNCAVEVKKAELSTYTLSSGSSLDITCTVFPIVTPGFNSIFAYLDNNNNGVYDAGDSDFGWDGDDKPGNDLGQIIFKNEVVTGSGNKQINCGVYSSSNEPYDRSYQNGGDAKAPVLSMITSVCSQRSKDQCSTGGVCKWVDQCRTSSPAYSGYNRDNNKLTKDIGECVAVSTIVSYICDATLCSQDACDGGTPAQDTKEDYCSAGVLYDRYNGCNLNTCTLDDASGADKKIKDCTDQCTGSTDSTTYKIKDDVTDYDAVCNSQRTDCKSTIIADSCKTNIFRNPTDTLIEAYCSGVNAATVEKDCNDFDTSSCVIEVDKDKLKKRCDDWGCSVGACLDTGQDIVTTLGTATGSCTVNNEYVDYKPNLATSTPTWGKTAESTETACSDGKDNDCNNKYDANRGANSDSACCVYNGNEVCDGKDNDCNGKVDDGLTFKDYYLDSDGDGFGTGNAVNACISPGANYVTKGGDCNDGNANINPGKAEICNGIDDDCNGQVDDGLTFVDYYLDNDRDTYGIGNAINACTSPGANYATRGGDCNDNDASLNPSAKDVCDGIDNDCNPVTADGSGQQTPLNDKQQGICSGTKKICAGAIGWQNNYPAGYEDGTELTCTDSKDNDCNGVADCIDTACAKKTGPNGLTCCQTREADCPADGAEGFVGCTNDNTRNGAIGRFTCSARNECRSNTLPTTNFCSTGCCLPRGGTSTCINSGKASVIDIDNDGFTEVCSIQSPGNWIGADCGENGCADDGTQTRSYNCATNADCKGDVGQCGEEVCLNNVCTAREKSNKQQICNTLMPASYQCAKFFSCSASTNYNCQYAGDSTLCADKYPIAPGRNPYDTACSGNPDYKCNVDVCISEAVTTNPCCLCYSQCIEAANDPSVAPESTAECNIAKNYQWTNNQCPFTGGS